MRQCRPLPLVATGSGPSVGRSVKVLATRIARRAPEEEAIGHSIDSTECLVEFGSLLILYTGAVSGVMEENQHSFYIHSALSISSIIPPIAD